MGSAKSRLKAKLFFELSCPSCSKPMHLPATEDEATESRESVKCPACEREFRPKVEVRPRAEGSSLELLEVTLGKLLKDLLPVCSDVERLQIEAELLPLNTGKNEEKEEAEEEDKENQREIAGLDIPDVTSLLQNESSPSRDGGGGENLLTSYSMGSTTGVEEISKLLRADPGNRQLKEWLAFAHYRNNELKEAVKTYLELIKDDPKDVNSHYYLANSYFKLGFKSAAAKGWEKVQSLAPSSPLASKAKKRSLKVA